MTSSPPDARRIDLDWIRIGAFALLILYHVGMFYVTWDYHVKSPHASHAVEPFMFLTNPWRLTLLFIVSLFFTPLIQAVPAVATAPALVVVGIFMFQSVAQLNLRELEEAAPAFIIIIATPLTFSIAEGIGLGLVAYAVIHLATSRGRQLTGMVYALAGIFALHLFRELFTH